MQLCTCKNRHGGSDDIVNWDPALIVKEVIPFPSFYLDLKGREIIGEVFWG